jgi:hypothetical protein
VSLLRFRFLAALSVGREEGTYHGLAGQIGATECDLAEEVWDGGAEDAEPGQFAIIPGGLLKLGIDAVLVVIEVRGQPPELFDGAG